MSGAAPTLADLHEASAAGDVGATYWQGMTQLAAAGPHVFLKISMLCYVRSPPRGADPLDPQIRFTCGSCVSRPVPGQIDPKWDESKLVRTTVARLLRIFGPERCFFASNYPVDLLPSFGAWTPDKLYPAFLSLAREALQTARLPCDDATVRALFRDNARRAYGV